MLTDVGEYLVGAYLQLIEECDFVDYNVRPPGGGIEGLSELDVIGLNFKTRTVFLCEVTTHIRGLQYGSHHETIIRIRSKHERQVNYAKRYLTNFDHVRFQFWSPVVPKGYLTQNLETVEGLELVINGEYKSRVGKLADLAKRTSYDARNPVFRLMQIFEHMRG